MNISASISDNSLLLLLLLLFDCAMIGLDMVASSFILCRRFLVQVQVLGEDYNLRTL